LRILQLVQERDRPASWGSGSPSEDLTTIFSGRLEHASALMTQPRMAALAVRHLESRCDAILASLEALEASFRADRDREDRLP